MPGARLHGLFQEGAMLQQLMVGLWVCAGSPRVLLLKDLSSHTAGHQQGAGPAFRGTLFNKPFSRWEAFVQTQSHTTADAVRLFVSLIKQQQFTQEVFSGCQKKSYQQSREEQGDGYSPSVCS